MDLKKFEKNTKYDYWQRKKRRRFIRQNKKCKKGQIVLLGDSITEMFDVKLLDGCSKLEIYNRGIGGDTTNMLLKRLDSNVLNIEPAQIILLIGTNDFGRGADCDYVMKNIEIIVQKIKTALPKTHLVIQCVYPVNSNKYELEPDRNKNIDCLNERLYDFAETNKIDILDITKELKNIDGQLDSSYSDDGVHPNKNGYDIVSKAIGKVVLS